MLTAESKQLREERVMSLSRLRFKCDQTGRLLTDMFATARMKFLRFSLHLLVSLKQNDSAEFEPRDDL